MPPIVLITRPDDAAQRLARMLRQRWTPAPDIVVSPVMRLRVLANALTLDGVRALIFTSRTGVEIFAQLSPRRDLPCYVVGRATQAEAERQGLSAVCAGGDGEELCTYLTSSGLRGPFLHLHGDHVAGDVAGRLRAAGLTLREEVIYSQQAQALTPAAMSGLNGMRPILLPLFSPRSARLFFEMAQGPAPLLCAAMSRNVAAEVPEARVTRLICAERPDMKAMLDSLDDLREYAIQLESAKRAK